jgi:hypothetical protein
LILLQEIWYLVPLMEVCAINKGIYYFIAMGYIANVTGDTMYNGSGINPGLYTSECYNSGLHIPQGNLILPDLKDSTIYHLFHLTADYMNWGSSLYPTKLYHSIIDMKQNNGKGEATLKNEILINDTLQGNILGIKHANGRDYWINLLCPYSLDYYTIPFDIDGIGTPIKQSHSVYPLSDYFSQMGVSPDGSMMAAYNQAYGIHLYYFDRCIGQIKNGVSFAIPEIQNHITVGSPCFSPDSKVLYVSAQEELYQYDLTGTDIANSRQTIGVFDGLLDPQESAFCFSYLAPDNKIYTFTRGQSKSMSVINNPDSLGSVCNFVQHGLQLN